MKAYSHLSAEERIRIDELRNREGLGVRQIALRISHECLHRWIHANPRRALDLRRYLPRGKLHRTHARGRRSKGPRIPMRVPIADRPKRVDPHREFGHYESDTVIGAAPSKRRIDRTRDNGTESSCHLLVDEAPGMLAYYADPYSSYQRGSNENRNGRIRRHLPERTGFDGLTDAGLQAIVQEINDTPMKVPDWETPNEAWYRKLGKVMSKTSHPQTNVALTNR